MLSFRDEAVSRRPSEKTLRPRSRSPCPDEVALELDVHRMKVVGRRIDGERRDVAKLLVEACSETTEVFASAGGEDEGASEQGQVDKEIPAGDELTVTGASGVGDADHPNQPVDQAQ